MLTTFATTFKTLPPRWAEAAVGPARPEEGLVAPPGGDHRLAGVLLKRVVLAGRLGPYKGEARAPTIVVILMAAPEIGVSLMDLAPATGDIVPLQVHRPEGDPQLPHPEGDPHLAAVSLKMVALVNRLGLYKEEARAPAIVVIRTAVPETGVLSKDLVPVEQIGAIVPRGLMKWTLARHFWIGRTQL